MAENTSRGLFALNGITGMLIATVLLLSIMAFLLTNAINIQTKEAKHFYDPAPIVNSLDNVKMISTENAKYDLSNL
ncbi:MAG TPA: DUF4006 family protein [Nitratifractor sp.]|nr:DUF4006 family protein [Nitratifractor sp.]HHD75141.1 DUF4006 family protein [Nitratifractor sp.]